MSCPGIAQTFSNCAADGRRWSGRSLNLILANAHFVDQRSGRFSGLVDVCLDGLSHVNCGSATAEDGAFQNGRRPQQSTNLPRRTSTRCLDKESISNFGSQTAGLGVRVNYWLRCAACLWTTTRRLPQLILIKAGSYTSWDTFLSISNGESERCYEG